MMDKEVLREIWHGQLPLCFKMHQDDISGMQRPEPYYMMVSRVTYFPLVLDRVVKYFCRFMDQSKPTTTDMWLDYEGQPIKWHHPIGLSWDLFGSHYDLPWRLILHFSDFPAKELVRCNTKASIETNFMSSLKEADALKHKGAVIKNMVRKDHNQLWSSLVNDKFDQFWLINKRLMEHNDNELFRFIPFRLYLPDYTYVQKSIRPCTTERHIFQVTTSPSTLSQDTGQAADQEHEVRPTIRSPTVYENEIGFSTNYRCHHINSNETGDCNDIKVHRCSTMLDLIQVSFKHRLNDLLISNQESTQDDVQDESQETKDAINPTTNEAVEVEPHEQNETNLIDVSQFKYRFISHGIEIPFDTPLQWLSEHFSYPDNFLHICAVNKH